MKSNLIFAIFCFFALVSGEKVLKRVLNPVRHGARGHDFALGHILNAASVVYNNDTLREIIVGLTLPHGYDEMYHLGEWMRERFQGFIDFETQASQGFDVRIDKTDVYRISEVALAYTQGLYPLGTGYNVSGVCQLPQCASAAIIMDNPRLFAYKNCPRYGVLGLESFLSSILPEFPEHQLDKFLAIISDPNFQAEIGADSSLVDWYYDVWVPKSQLFLSAGPEFSARLHVPGAIGVIGRAAENELINPSDFGANVLAGQILTLEEFSNPNKFLGLYAAAGGLFLPFLVDAPANTFYASLPYLDALMEDFVFGRNHRTIDEQSAIDYRIKLHSYIGHGQTVEYMIYPFSPAEVLPIILELEYPRQGDFALFELYEDDETGEEFVKTFVGKRYPNIELVELTPTNCSSSTCPINEWLDSIEPWLKLDTATECSILPRCQANFTIDSWNNGAVFKFVITPGWENFGWNLELEFDKCDFDVLSNWGGKIIGLENNLLKLKNFDDHNYLAKEGVRLEEIGMQISYDGNLPEVVSTRFNGLLCDQHFELI